MNSNETGVMNTPAPNTKAPLDVTAVREAIIKELRTVFDPEIPVDVYELGLIYEVNIDANTGAVNIIMTLTSPMCPSAQELPVMVAKKANSVQGVRSTNVDVVFDPPWGPALMTEAARLKLGMM